MKSSLCIVIAASLMTAASVAPATADCRFGRVIYCGGCTLDRAITVTHGSPCRFSSTFFGGVISTKALVRPKHGIFAHAAAYDFAYQVQPGYKGTDYFEYEIIYKQRDGRPARVVLRNQVTILD